MDETLSVRVSAAVMRELERLAELSKQSRSDALRDALQSGIASRRLELAIEAYRSGRVSIGRARALAAVPLPMFLDAVKRFGVLLSYDVDDLRTDIEWADQA